MPPTTIAWYDHSINPIRARNLETGAVGHYCEKISPGCRHCYSSALQARFRMPSFQEQRHPGSSIEPFLDTTKLEQVLQREKPTKYFWCDMTDVFGEWVPDAWLDQCFATMALTPQHTHMVLTKRPERMLRYLCGNPFSSDPVDHAVWRIATLAKMCDAGKLWMPWPLPNVWCGVSVENQAAAETRIPLLLQVPVAIRFLSCEPILSPLDLTKVRDEEIGAQWNVLEMGISWLICGGESGPQARPCHLRWLAHLVIQCQMARIPVFVKQLGRQAYDTHEIAEGRFCAGCVSCRYHTKDTKGADPTEWPLALRIQEFPQTHPIH